MAVRVKIRKTEARLYARAVLMKYTRQTLAEMLNSARVIAPARGPNPSNVVGGHLKHSLKWKIEIKRTITGVLGSDLEYARVVHKGARPHVIRPRRRKALVFKWTKAHPDTVIKSGKWAGYTVRQEVHHPGMKGTTYLTTPLVIIGLRRNWRVVLKKR